jgi:hypothetical protein
MKAQEIYRRAAASVGAGTTQVVQEVGVVAARFFESISEDG